MDAELEARLRQFLAGRLGWKQITMKHGFPRFHRMEAAGFDFAKFATGLDAAEDEAERFIAALRSQGAKPGGIRGYQKSITALAKFHRHRGFELRWDPEARPKPRIYTRSELDRLHGVPFRRAYNQRVARALGLAHMGFGMRPGELAPMWAVDIQPDDATFFVRFPEKDNPQRTLRVELEIFRPNRALMAYVNKREAPATQANALWTYEDEAGQIHPMPAWKLQHVLRDMGRSVGVQANCTRGRHTRATALTYNGKPIQYVAFFLGHTGPFSASHRYVEVVDADLATHLAGTKWLTKSWGA